MGFRRGCRSPGAGVTQLGTGDQAWLLYVFYLLSRLCRCRLHSHSPDPNSQWAESFHINQLKTISHGCVRDQPDLGSPSLSLSSQVVLQCVKSTVKANHHSDLFPEGPLFSHGSLAYEFSVFTKVYHFMFMCVCLHVSVCTLCLDAG